MGDDMTFEMRLRAVEADLFALRQRVDMLTGKQTGNWSPLVFSSPVDPTAFGEWGKLGNLVWWDATPYGKPYGDLQHIHTGADLNLGGFKDAGAKVYAAADGVIVFTGKIDGWQGDVVVMSHNDAGREVWTRYAHIKTLSLPVNSRIVRGSEIGIIADYGKAGPEGDHLHYDVIKNLVSAGDWPGRDLQRTLRDYYNPLEFHKAHRG